MRERVNRLNNRKTSSNNKLPLLSIPTELLLKIGKDIPFKDFVKLTSTCKSLYILTDDQYAGYLIRQKLPFLARMEDESWIKAAKRYYLAFANIDQNYKTYTHIFDVAKGLASTNRFKVKVNEFPQTPTDPLYVPTGFKENSNHSINPTKKHELVVQISSQVTQEMTLTSGSTFFANSNNILQRLMGANIHRSKLKVDLHNGTYSVYADTLLDGASSAHINDSSSPKRRSVARIFSHSLAYDNMEYCVFRPMLSARENIWMIRCGEKSIYPHQGTLGFSKTHWETALTLPSGGSIDKLFIQQDYIFVFWCSYNISYDDFNFHLLVLLRKNGKKLGELNNLINLEGRYNGDISICSSSTHFFITHEHEIKFLPFEELFAKMNSDSIHCWNKAYIPLPNNHDIQGWKLFHKTNPIETENDMNIKFWHKLLSTNSRPLDLIFSKNEKYIWITTDSFEYLPEKSIYYLLDLKKRELHEFLINREDSRFEENYESFEERWFIDENLTVYLFNSAFLNDLWNKVDQNGIEVSNSNSRSKLLFFDKAKF